MNPVADLVAYLRARNVACALIGGTALGAHGVARATFDIDLLVADAAVLALPYWADFSGLGDPEIRVGDADDPLVGLVRFANGPPLVDVIVGRAPLAPRILARCQTFETGGVRLPIVDPGDLILLKLLAAGPQDLLDIQLLLRAYPDLHETVEARLGDAPTDAHRTWSSLPK